MFMVVAWRVAYLMCQGRTNPDLDAGHHFDWAEINAADVLAKKPQPARPGVNEVLRLIAQREGMGKAGLFPPE